MATTDVYALTALSRPDCLHALATAESAQVAAATHVRWLRSKPPGGLADDGQMTAVLA
jgi:hypothetical protein